VARLHRLAKALDVRAACLFHGELEVDVLGHAHLLVEQRRLALVAQLLAPATTPATPSISHACTHKPESATQIHAVACRAIHPASTEGEGLAASGAAMYMYAQWWTGTAREGGGSGRACPGGSG
jgi:hypothetical protein